MAGAALAAPPQDRPQDYRWSIALTPQPGAGLSRISVPTDVYLHARSASLDDVRLFDSTGKPLAFSLTAPPAQSRTQRDTLADAYLSRHRQTHRLLRTGQRGYPHRQ